MLDRRKTKTVFVGNVPIGGHSKISIQSMTNTQTADVESTVSQIHQLEVAGCDLIRSAINSRDDAEAIEKIKQRINIPFIADIQFDYKLGIMAVQNGCDCLRINPGNIGSRVKVKEVVAACKEYRVPIRIGVNSGSLTRDIINMYGGVNAQSLVASAIEEIRTLEELGFDNIKISIKSSNVNTMIESYTEMSKLVDYPLHLGVTEAGPESKGTIKSSIGIGTLLYNGIGDTIRVSITGDPVKEVLIGRDILRSLGLITDGIDLISCPTCSRTKVDLIGLVERAELLLADQKINATVAIMGCPVNGPGEAKEADIGIACTKGYGVIFKKGKVVKQVPENELLDELMFEVMELSKNV